MKPALYLWPAPPAGPPAGSAQVQIAPGPEKIRVEIGGRPFTDFYVAGAGLTKPYLHPLRAASGTYVTRMWPMENVAEEAKTQKDHLHQRGLWFAHEKVNGLDFWNNEASYTTPNRGKIVLRNLGKCRAARTRASSRPRSTGPIWRATSCSESRRMTFYADPRLRPWISTSR